MAALQHFSFSKLMLPPDEELLWCASNPTFHRTWDYGVAISGETNYLFSPFWLWLASWRRYPLSAVRRVFFWDSYWLPRLELQTDRGTITFRTPYDGYQDEMDFDRRNLAKAVELLARLGPASNNSSRPTPLRGSA